MKDSEFKSQEDLLELALIELRLINKKLTNLTSFAPSIPCIDNAEALKILNISDRTAKLWRKNGTLPFSRVGRKIYYLIDDIIEMIRKAKVNIFRS